jgi:hypothetical protein
MTSPSIRYLSFFSFLKKQKKLNVFCFSLFPWLLCVSAGEISPVSPPYPIGDRTGALGVAC